MNTYIWYSVWLLLPLIPSILLFKVLPTNSANVSTVTKGLEIKLSGAVAIYALIVYFCDPFKKNLIVIPERKWTIVASFSDKLNRPVPISEIKTIDAIPPIKYYPLGNLTALIELPNVEINDNVVEIPYRVQIGFNSYESLIISNDSLKSASFCNIDWRQNEIKLKKVKSLDSLIVGNLANTATLPSGIATEKIISQ